MKNILNRKNLFASHSFSVLAILLLIILVINLISINHFARLDLTNEKQYSLSSATKNTLDKIDDPLFIKAYFSQKLPPDLSIVDQYVKDILSEYHSISGNVRIEFIDPTQNEETEKEVQALGIPSIEMQMIEKDEFKIQKGYLGIAILYEDKKEIIPVVESTLNLEYDLTSAIKRLTSDSLKMVTFTTGHQEHGITQSPYQDPNVEQTADYTIIKKALEKNYLVHTLDTTDEKPITSADTLIVAGPKTDLTDKEIYEIDQFIMKGGRVIFLLDQINIMPGLQAVPQTTGLEELIKHYGIQMNQDLVIDSTNENVAFTSGSIQFFLPYPFWPKLIRDNFDLTNPVTSKLQTISFPWVSSLTTLEYENIQTNVWATTSKKGSTVTQPFNLDPQQNFANTNLSKTPIIVESKGQFASYFAGKEIPLAQSAKDNIDDTAYSPELTENNEPLLQSADQSQIIVIADSDFIADSYLQRFADNAIFFLNAVDYLTLDSDLINIRSKSITNREIKETSDTTRTWIKIINIILIPLLIIAIGVIKFYLRKKK